MALWYHLHKRQAHRTDDPETAIANAVERMRDALQASDPDTARQWTRLRTVLETRPAPAATSRQPRFTPALKPAFALGAAVAVVSLALLWWLTPPSAVTYATARGEQSDVLLADSSRIMLNHTSTLIVNRAARGGDRLVTLDGEAYFHVQKTGGTFDVSTRAGTVRVLGTEFNVRVRGNRLDVAVISGSVLVTGQTPDGNPGVVLHAGSYTSCIAGGAPDMPSGLPFADYPGWMHGRLHFHRTPLTAVAAEITARFDVTITLAAAGAGAQTITGSLDARDADTVLTTLCQLTGLRYRHDANGYTLF